MDPYKVLGVTPQTSDDDIKRAYRELARKYHPDNYAGNPLADLAETRMKEINEAYDEIMNARANKSGGSTTGAGQNYSYGYGGTRTSSSSNPIYSQIRAAINAGNLSMAEEMLQRCPQRDAEWYFLMGSVYYRKGWFDEANRAYTQACSMDPMNAEYRNALNILNMSGGYGGYRPMMGVDTCSCCTQMMCMECCWEMCGGLCGSGC